MIIALDIGGTKIAAAAMDPQHAEPIRSEVRRRPTPHREGGPAITAVCAELIAELQVDYPQARAVGIGTAGAVSRDGRRITASTDAILNWAGTPLADLIEQACQLPVAVENDVAAHARGECVYGAGRGHKSVVMMALGTGIGGAFIIDGTHIFGRRGLAGDMGHLPLSTPAATQLRCTCGIDGAHLEAVASGPGMYRWYLERGGDPAVADTRELAERARHGEGLAGEVIADAAAQVGSALAGVANIIDPDIVVVGGGVPEIGPLWWEPAQTAYKAAIVPYLGEVPMVPATLGWQAALLGAAALAEATFTPATTPAPTAAPTPATAPGAGAQSAPTYAGDSHFSPTRKGE